MKMTANSAANNVSVVASEAAEEEKKPPGLVGTGTRGKPGVGMSDPSVAVGGIALRADADNVSGVPIPVIGAPTKAGHRRVPGPITLL